MLQATPEPDWRGFTEVVPEPKLVNRASPTASRSTSTKDSPPAACARSTTTTDPGGAWKAPPPSDPPVNGSATPCDLLGTGLALTAQVPGQTAGAVCPGTAVTVPRCSGQRRSRRPPHRPPGHRPRLGRPPGPSGASSRSALPPTGSAPPAAQASHPDRSWSAFCRFERAVTATRPAAAAWSLAYASRRSAVQSQARAGRERHASCAVFEAAGGVGKMSGANAMVRTRGCC